jgi:hypothetical protein
MCQDCRCPGRDLNPTPPEYEAGVLSTRPLRSVEHHKNLTRTLLTTVQTDNIVRSSVISLNKMSHWYIWQCFSLINRSISGLISAVSDSHAFLQILISKTRLDSCSCSQRQELTDTDNIKEACFIISESPRVADSGPCFSLMSASTHDINSNEAMVEYDGVCLWREYGVRRSTLCWWVLQESGFSSPEDCFTSNLVQINFIHILLSPWFAKMMMQ